VWVSNCHDCQLHLRVPSHGDSAAFVCGLRTQLIDGEERMGEGKWSCEGQQLLWLPAAAVGLNSPPTVAL
jgi:hypothetical protein